jgi:phage tail sheath protein FI
MAPTATYPGVYVYEAPPSGARAIVGVSTSICAMVLDFPRGPVDYPVRVFDAAGVARNFGQSVSTHRDYYLLDQFFVNGGATVYVIRAKRPGAKPSSWDGGNGWTAKAGRHVVGREKPVEDVGTWGDRLRLQIIPEPPQGGVARFTVEVAEVDPQNPAASSRVQETHSALSAATAERAIAADSGVISFQAGTGTPPYTGTWADDPIPVGTDGRTDGPIPLSNMTVTVAIGADSSSVDFDLNVPDDTVPARVAALVQREIRTATTTELLTATDTDAINRLRHLQSATVRVIDGRLYLQAGLFPGYDDKATMSVANGSGIGFGAGDVVGEVRAVLSGGSNGTGPPTETEIVGDKLDRTGMHALEDVDLFNILCLPGLSAIDASVAGTAYGKAAEYCEERRAFLIMDMPGTDSTGKDSSAVDEPLEAEAWISSAPKRDNAAAYFPRLVYRVRGEDRTLRDLKLPNSAAIAGIYTRTDNDRNVWKAPAGLETDIRLANRLDYVLNDAENGFLNPLGVNCLRTFPVNGTVVWGARTARGADSLADQYKYIPVRRMAYFIEESLFRGTQWAVFEPNDEPLWSQLRLSVGAFMHQQFRKGAFQGATPREAYLVKCDAETTTQADIDRGIVNIVVGFAPLKPAEFVFIEIQQLARAEE